MAPCIKLLCMFDHYIYQLAQVKVVTIQKESAREEQALIHLEFTDSEAMKKIFSHIPEARCFYAVELIKDGDKAEVLDEQVIAFREPHLNNGDAYILQQEANKAEFRIPNVTKVSCCCISTMINGTTIAKTQIMLPKDENQ